MRAICEFRNFSLVKVAIGNRVDFATPQLSVEKKRNLSCRGTMSLINTSFLQESENFSGTLKPSFRTADGVVLNLSRMTFSFIETTWYRHLLLSYRLYYTTPTL